MANAFSFINVKKSEIIEPTRVNVLPEGANQTQLAVIKPGQDYAVTANGQQVQAFDADGNQTPLVVFPGAQFGNKLTGV